MAQCFFWARIVLIFGIAFGYSKVALTAGEVRLDQFVTHAINSGNAGGAGAPGYNRMTDFGGWVVNQDDDPRNCLDTHAVVMARNSKTPVEISKCKVKHGSWVDLYSGKAYASPHWFQVDHMVPLKNAWLSGAWKWSPQRRCHYANYFHNSYHLIPVYIWSNWAKKASGPDGYLPANVAYRCEYVKNFAKIKLIWDLDLSKSEALAIQKVWHDNACGPSFMSFDLAELNVERTYSNRISTTCQGF